MPNQSLTANRKLQVRRLAASGSPARAHALAGRASDLSAFRLALSSRRAPLARSLALCAPRTADCRLCNDTIAHAQGEIDKTFKKIADGVAEFDVLLDVVQEQGQKDKFDGASALRGGSLLSCVAVLCLVLVLDIVVALARLLAAFLPFGCC